jgi:predicted ATPase/DNA-binding SARP family transcriptional activator
MGAKSGLRLSVLGSIGVILDDQPLPKLPTLRAQGLLIYLAVEAALGSPEQRREALMELFWPGMPPQSSRKNLRTTLYYLRQVMGETFLLSDRHTVQINPDFPIWLDVAEFLRLLKGSQDQWQEAIDLYRGDFLVDFTIPDADPFEEWAAARRAAFRQQLLHSLDRLADHSLKIADFDRTERLARCQLEVDNLRESAWRQLMESLAQRGRRGEALTEYEACVAVLWNELGIEPSFETSKLREDILAGNLPSQETMSRPLPPTQEGPRHNLPAQMTPFIGREREMAEIQDLLGTARLVTLTGPGGTGKTRLGLQVAESVVENYADGVTFIGLSSTTDPALVPNAIASELGVVERPDQPLVESLKLYFSKKHALLLLDSFEHVLEATPLVSGLLSAATQLNVLATSRESLHLTGEQEYPVPPLTVPDLAPTKPLPDLSTFESVALFIQRARAVSPNFSLTEDNAAAVAGICLRLDGLPLAIELAAARIKLFSPQQMLERLESRLKVLMGGSRDLPARQRTLRDAIDWSYNLLDEGEQRLFARLAVFTGGRTIEAVEAVCAPGSPVDALDGLESLLNKSLLYQEEGPGGNPRFMMLETIHEYAWERLANNGEEQQIRDKHLEYFLTWVEEIEPGYRRHGQLLLLDKTEAEMDNLRTAFNWAMESGNLEAGARLVAPLEYFLHYRDHFVEGYDWIKRILDRIEAIPHQYQMTILRAASRIAYINGDLAQNKMYAQRALALARIIGDRQNEAWSYTNMALASINSIDRQEIAEGLMHCEIGLDLFGQLDDKTGMAQALTNLAILANEAGDYDRAQEAIEKGLSVCQETGEILRQSLLLSNLAFTVYHKSQYDRSKRLQQQYVRQMFEIGAKHQALSGMASLAGPLSKLGEPEKAARLLGASTLLLVELGAEFEPVNRPFITEYTADVRAQLDEATFEAAWAEGQAMTLEQAVAYVLGE